MSQKIALHPSKIIIGKWNSWWLAMRPKTLTAAIIPIFVGTFLAKHSVEKIDWSLAIFALLGALCIQIGTNFINDALDFKKGADTETRIGPMRVTQSGLIPIQRVLQAGIACFVFALIFGIPLILHAGLPLAIILIVSVLCGYLYTGGPFPLAYYGLGDLFVLLFFGLVSTCSLYFLQTGVVDKQALLAGTQIGMLATVLIAINNLRDRQEDGKVHKYTLAVRFGQQFACYEISFLIIAPFLLNYLWLMLGYPLAAILPLLALPLAIVIIRNIWQTQPGVIYNQYLAHAALLHLLFGVLLILGFYLK